MPLQTMHQFAIAKVLVFSSLKYVKCQIRTLLWQTKPRSPQ